MRYTSKLIEKDQTFLPRGARAITRELFQLIHAIQKLQLCNNYVILQNPCHRILSKRFAFSRIACQTRDSAQLLIL